MRHAFIVLVFAIEIGTHIALAVNVPEQPQVPVTTAIRIESGGSCYVALRDLANAYEAKHPELSFTVKGYSSAVGLHQLRNRRCQIAVVEDPFIKHVRKEWPKAFPSDTKPAGDIAFAQTALGIVVHPDNRLKQITVDRLRDVWTGKTTQFHRLGGTPGKIQVYTVKPTHELTGSLASEFLVNYRQWTPNAQTLKSMANVIASVAQDKNGIGCIVLTPGHKPTSVKLLAIVNPESNIAIDPSEDNIVLEKYPLVRRYRMILADHSPSEAHAFCEFAASDDAVDIVKKAKLFPIAIKRRAEAEARIKAFHEGHGPKLPVAVSAEVRQLLRDLAEQWARAERVIQIDETVVRPKREHSDDLRVVFRGDRTYTSDKMMDTQIVGGRGVALIVNSKNLVTALTPKQVQQVFHGQTKTWQAVGPADGRIQLYALPGDNDATPLLYAKAIIQPKRTQMKYKRDDAEVIKAVMFDEQGLGYVNLAAIKPEHLAAEEGQPGLRILAIGAGKKAVVPSAVTISDGTYPYAQRLQLLVSPKASDAAKSFVQFITSHDLDSVFREYGFLQAEPTGRKDERSATPEAAGALSK